MWKVPARGDRRLRLDVRLPPRCRCDDAVTRFTSGAHVQRWRAACPGGLLGATVAIAGLADTRTDVLVRIDRLDGTRRLLGTVTAATVAYSVTLAAATLGRPWIAAFWTIDRTVRFWPSDTWAGERPVVPRTAAVVPGATIGAWDRRHPE